MLNVHAHARGKPQQKKNKAQQLQRPHKPLGYGPSVIRYACCREFCVHLVFSFVTVFSTLLQSADNLHTKQDPTHTKKVDRRISLHQLLCKHSPQLNRCVAVFFYAVFYHLAHHLNFVWT